MTYTETVRRVNRFFVTVIVISLVVVIGYIVVETFIGAFATQASTLTGKAASVYNFLTGNITMTFFIFALIILGAVVKIFLWPSQSQYQGV